MPEELPSRYTQLHEVRAKYGSKADALAAFFMKADPNADNLVAFLSDLPPQRGKRLFDMALEHGIAAVNQPPSPLRTFFEEVESVPSWLDPGLLNIGSRTHVRCGLLCGVILACSALPLAYRSGAGTKPLIFSGKVVERVVRRLWETNRFYVSVCLPGGLEARAAGWKMTVKVRVMHAQMRRLLGQSKSKRWQREDWGVPINQLDLAATQLMFSVTLLQHLRHLGCHFTRAESDGVMHLWRYVAYLLGISGELICTHEAAARRHKQLLLDVAGGPDADSLRLTKVLMDVGMPTLLAMFLERLFPGRQHAAQGKWSKLLGRIGRGLAAGSGLWPRPKTGLRDLVRLCYGLSHEILGDRLAAELKYPTTFWRRTAPFLVRSLVVPWECCRRTIPGAGRLAHRLGMHQFHRQM
jgi:ER-bound oxygenase mpaB/B'/Rubber oxygenase, catalytic domain